MTTITRTFKLTPAEIQEVLDTHGTQPVEPPDPVEPPPVIEPPDPVDPEMYNIRFSDIWGADIELPASSARPKVYQIKDFVVRAESMCMAIRLPAITSRCTLSVSKASSRHGPSGLRFAQFSYHRDFAHPISSTGWGTSALNVNLDASDSRRTIFLNVRMAGVDQFGLMIQPVISIL